MTIRGYELIQWTQHWRLIHGTYYRDALARRLTDGAVRLITVPDHQ